MEKKNDIESKYLEKIKVINRKKNDYKDNNKNKFNVLAQNNKESNYKDDTNILSFRTTQNIEDKKNVIEELSNKVTKSLISNINKGIQDNKEIKENKEEINKIFIKKNEKELEIFETDRYKQLKIVNQPSSKEKYFYLRDEEGNPMEIKYLNQVICTLSKIENGYATFVDSNDLIFVIPSLFIPKNLNIGNTYNFKLGEIEQADDKLKRVNEIHKYYSNEQNIQNLDE